MDVPVFSWFIQVPKYSRYSKISSWFTTGTLSSLCLEKKICGCGDQICSYGSFRPQHLVSLVGFKILHTSTYNRYNTIDLLPVSYERENAHSSHSHVTLLMLGKFVQESVAETISI